MVLFSFFVGVSFLCRDFLRYGVLAFPFSRSCSCVSLYIFHLMVIQFISLVLLPFLRQDTCLIGMHSIYWFPFPSPSLIQLHFFNPFLKTSCVLFGGPPTFFLVTFSWSSFPIHASPTNRRTSKRSTNCPLIILSPPVFSTSFVPDFLLVALVYVQGPDVFSSKWKRPPLFALSPSFYYGTSCLRFFY